MSADLQPNVALAPKSKAKLPPPVRAVLHSFVTLEYLIQKTGVLTKRDRLMITENEFPGIFDQTRILNFRKLITNDFTQFEYCIKICSSFHLYRCNIISDYSEQMMQIILNEAEIHPEKIKRSQFNFGGNLNHLLSPYKNDRGFDKIQNIVLDFQLSAESLKIITECMHIKVITFQSRFEILSFGADKMKQLPQIEEVIFENQMYKSDLVFENARKLNISGVFSFFWQDLVNKLQLEKYPNLKHLAFSEFKDLWYVMNQESTVSPNWRKTWTQVKDRLSLIQNLNLNSLTLSTGPIDQSWVLSPYYGLNLIDINSLLATIAKLKIPDVKIEIKKCKIEKLNLPSNFCLTEENPEKKPKTLIIEGDKIQNIFKRTNINRILAKSSFEIDFIVFTIHKIVQKKNEKVGEINFTYKHLQSTHSITLIFGFGQQINRNKFKLNI